MRKMLSVMLVSLLVPPSPVFAQDDVAAILRDLPSGARVTLELAGGKKVTGAVVEVRPDAIVLARAGLDGSKTLTLPTADGGVRVDFSTVTKATVVSRPRTAASPAPAQELPVATLSGGFASVGDVDVALRGFFLEGERARTPRLSVVGQMHRVTATGDGFFYSTIDWTDLFVGGGIRFTMRPGRGLRPHVHALAGLYQVYNDETITDPRRRPGPADHYTDNYATIVLGAGVNIMERPHFGFRAGVDVLMFSGVLPTGRFTVGVVLPFGRR